MDLEQIKSELRAIGFTEDKLNQLMELAAQEALAIALEDLETNTDDATMEEVANAMQTQPVDANDAIKKLELVFEKAYGANAQSKKRELILSYLKQSLEDTKSIKDIASRYQAGDPTAVAAVKAQEGNPDAEEIGQYVQQHQ